MNPDLNRLIKTRWRLIPVDGDLVDGEEQWARKPDYKTLTNFVTPKVVMLPGSYMEHVNVYARFNQTGRFERLDMFVDETGRIRGLPRNDRATAIYREATMRGLSARSKPDDPEELDYICGPALLFERRVWW